MSLLSIDVSDDVYFVMSVKVEITSSGFATNITVFSIASHLIILSVSFHSGSVSAPNNFVVE